MLHPEPMKSAGVAYIVLGLAIGFQGVAWFIAFQEFNRSRGNRGIRAWMLDVENVESVQGVLTMPMGPEFILVTVNADFDDNARTGDVENAIAELERRIKDQFSKSKRVFIEAESRN